MDEERGHDGLTHEERIARFRSQGMFRATPDPRDAEIVSLRETLEAAETALEPFSAFASKAEAFVESRVLAANDVSAIMAPTRDFRLRHFQIARDCLAKIKAALGKETGT